MKKDKIYSVIVMTISFFILLSVMYLGKSMGRDTFDQQARLKEQFPVINTESEADLLFENISPQELQNLSNESTLMVILVIIGSISVTILLILTKRFHKQLTAT